MPDFGHRLSEGELVAGNYRILGVAGSGGMGIVYRARDLRLERTVALKFLPSALTSTSHDVNAFLREARTASSLDHPNVGVIHGIENAEDGSIFIVMAFYEGRSLADRLRDGPLPSLEAIEIACQMCAGLAEAHARGIVHRDIKPSNVMLTSTHLVKIVDFGLATFLTDETASQVATAGTVAYMSPEQSMAHNVDRRTDIWALGIVLAEMLTGETPFHRPSVAAVLFAIINEPPKSIERIHPELQRILFRCLAKDPEKRYPTALDLRAALEAVQRTLPAEEVEAAATPATRETSEMRGIREAASQSAWSQPAAPRRSLPPALLAGGGILLVVAAGAIGIATYLAYHLNPRPHNVTTSPISSEIIAGTLAVLPPTVADPQDTQLASFGRGLSASLAQRLSDLSVNHDIAVLSAGQLQDRKVVTINDAARELGATSGLAIRLTRGGDLVHAAYSVSQPDKASDQPHVLASGTLSAPVSDMFSIENQLATATATALNIPLRTDEQRALAAHGTTFPEAYQSLLQARGYLLETFTPESFKSAQIMFNEALRIDPNYGAAKAGLGQSWLYAYHYTHQPAAIEQARTACSDAVTLGNAGADGHVCLGTLAQETGKPADAVVEFQKALQLQPASDTASIGLAKAYEKLNQLEKAEAVFKQAIALRPNYWRGYDLLGAFYIRRADYLNAEKMYRTATEKDPQSFRSYSNLGAVLLYLGRDQDASEAFEKSVAIRPTADAYVNAGVASFRQRRFSEAANLFRKSLELDSGTFDVWSSLGDAEYYGGNHTQAAIDYKKAIDLASKQLQSTPNDANILGALAVAHSMIGHPTEAIEFLNRSLAINHTDKELMFNAALIYNQLQQTGPALEWLSKALNAGYAPSVVARAVALDNLHSNPLYRQLMQSTQHQP